MTYLFVHLSNWTPSPTLIQLIPTLEQATFTSTLAAEERIQAPARVPEATRLFRKRQAAEDASLDNFQYNLSAVLHPLDVLGHMLLPLLQPDQVEHIFATLNDIRTLILHTEGTINQACNQLSLRAVNPSIRQQPTDREYTIASEKSLAASGTGAGGLYVKPCIGGYRSIICVRSSAASMLVKVDWSNVGIRYVKGTEGVQSNEGCPDVVALPPGPQVVELG
ncbi:hypothetical protein BDC45DRAFT_533848 [Circinella umbellata]|nr:hypothetical protein BDC45DRAFT_533848 [Circinella umbellata]